MGAGKRYSAGAIFLQVVPVFNNVQRAIEDEAKNWDRALGDQMEKSGEKAGERAGKAASKKIGEGLKDTDATVKVDADTKAAERKMGAFERSLKRAMDKAGKHIDGSVNKEVEKLRSELERLSRMRVGVDIGSKQLKREIADISADLKRLASKSPDIDVRFEAGKAHAELAAWNAAVDRANGQNISVRARVDTSDLSKAKRSADDASNSFRSFNGVLLAATSTGPALVPVLGAIAGGLFAIGPAAAVAGAGLGAVLVGFSGLGDAVSALQAQQDGAAMAAQTAGKAQVSNANAIRDAQEALADARRNAARAAEDAAERVADAREAAAEAIENALERQKDAQEAYRDSILEVKDAEQALREARANAAGTGHSLDDQIKSNDLAIEQAILDSFAATNDYNAVMADGSSTNTEQEQARVTMEQAQQALHELRDEAKELAKEKAKWDKEGVNGTEEVQSAQENLNDAIDAQRDAYENLRDAAKDVDEARADGAENVRDAIEDQNRVLADNKRAIEDAKRALADARAASDDAVDSINATQQALDNAMNALGPAGRKFALFLFGLKAGFREFRDDIQAAMLPSIQEAIEGFIGSKNAGVIRSALIGLAGGFGDFVKALSVSFQGPAWGAFFQMLADLGPDIQKAYGGAFIAFLEGMASILTTLAPFALDFAKGFERLMESFAGWAASKDGVDLIQSFMAYAKDMGPLVLEFFALLATTLVHVMTALAPYGEMILGLVVTLLEWISKMDQDTLGAILGGVLALITASQIAYSVMNLLMAGTALLTSPIGLFVFALVGLGLAVYYVYTQNETLGKILAVVAGSILALIVAMKAWRVITLLATAVQVGHAVAVTGTGKALLANSFAAKIAYGATKAWMIMTQIATGVTKVFAFAVSLLGKAWAANPLGIAILAIIAIVAGMVWAYKKFEWFRKAVDWTIEKVKDIFFGLWDFLFGHSVMPDIVDGMMWAADWIGKIFGWIGDFVKKGGAVFGWLWKNAVKPYLKLIMAYWKTVFHVMKAVWQKVLWPVLKLIGKVVVVLFKAYFKVYFALIKALVKAVFTAIEWYWDHILHPVFKVFAKVLGWLWKNVVKPVLGWIGEKFGDVFRGMKIVWDRVLKPVFDYIGEKALPKLKGAFQTAVDAIKVIWDGLKKVVGKPIKFVLDTIINKGLIDGFNKVAKWVGQDGFDHVPIPESLSSYATGGVLPGYTPGRDVHHFVSPTGGRLHLSGGEAIMRPEVTAAVGTGWVDRVNAAARTGGVAAVRKLMQGGQAFAKGGIFFPLPGGHFANNYANHDGVDINVGSGSDDYGMPFYSATSGKVTTTGYSRGYGNAVFVNSPYGELVYGHSIDGSIIVRPGQPVHPGDMLARVGSTGNSSAPHLHFGHPGGTYDWARALLAGSPVGVAGDPGGDSGPSMPGWLQKIIGKPMEWVKGLYGKATDALSDKFGDSPFIGTLTSMGKTLLSPLVDKIEGLFGGGGDGDAAGAPNVVATGSVQKIVQGVASAYGWANGAQWNALSEIVSRESGWNPNAANPTSSARGLFQKMTSLHGPIEGTVDGQARWGLDYIKRAYGDPTSALAFHNSHGWYSDGGVLPGGDAGEAPAGLPYNGTMMYDNGGYLPPGLTTVVNLTGKPEPVFTADQWAGMEGGGGQGGNIHYEPHFEGSNLTPGDVAADLNFTFRRIKRGGKYAGVGQ